MPTKINKIMQHVQSNGLVVVRETGRGLLSFVVVQSHRSSRLVSDAASPLTHPLLNICNTTSHRTLQSMALTRVLA
jgi:hypothetical protein